MKANLLLQNLRSNMVLHARRPRDTCLSGPYVTMTPELFHWYCAQLLRKPVLTLPWKIRH